MENIDQDLVAVFVPHPFILTTSGHRETHYDAGVQDMPRAHAEHDYSRAHGVEIVKPPPAVKK